MSEPSWSMGPLVGVGSLYCRFATHFMAWPSPAVATARPRIAVGVSPPW